MIMHCVCNVRQRLSFALWEEKSYAACNQRVACFTPQGMTVSLQAQDGQRAVLEEGLRSSRLQLQSVMQECVVAGSRLQASEGRCNEVEMLVR